MSSVITILVAIVITLNCAAGQEELPIDQCSGGDLETRVCHLEKTLTQLMGNNLKATTQTATTPTVQWTGFPCENHIVKGCDAMEAGEDHITLYATGNGSLPGAELCRVVSTVDSLKLDHYVLTMEVYSPVYTNRSEYQHAGIAFNVKDVENFDFVSFSTTSATDRCLQHGYEDAGRLFFKRKPLCAAAPVEGERWIKVSLKAAEHKVTACMDGLLGNTIDTQYATRSQMGVFLLNRHSDYMDVRNIEIRDPVTAPAEGCS